MKQDNGAALFGAGDPRGAAIGVIEAAPEDDRQSILTAILTQEKLKRKQTVVVLPEQSEAFHSPLDFKEFASALQDLQTELVFVLPANSSIIRQVRQSQYQVFLSLENYAQYARQFLNPPPPDEEIATEADKTLPTDQNAPPPVPSDDAPTTPLASPVANEGDEVQEEAKKDDEEGEDEEIPVVPQLVSPVPLRASLFRHPPPPVPQGVAPLPEQDASDNEPSAIQPVPINPRSRRAGRIWTLLALLLLVILLLGGVLGTIGGILPVAVLFPSITSATVTITPDSQTFQQSYQIEAVTTLANHAQRQVQARFLSMTTPPRTKTVAATGTGSYPAQHALGTLTFYNALSEEQKVPEGTVFTDDKGVQVISEEDALIPAALPPEEGIVTIQARALLAGAKGNTFQLTAPRPCCFSGISVKGNDDFHGGRDARNYTYVQQSDIEAATSALTATVLSAGQNALKAQMAPGERVGGDPQCLPDVASNHPAGEQAANVTVTLQITCTSEVYDIQTAQQLAESLFKADVEKRVGPGYAPLDHVATTVNSVQKKDASGTLQLQITAMGAWSYQFQNEQKQTFARLIAGQQANQAVAKLLQQRGVRKAKIDLSLAYNNMLPADPRRIAIIWQSLP
ncbi:hypothetical protein KSF_052790 [Reticulibacter mediterranei]|uniref:Baseplate protein J-like barrel domain-containing protein n=1 Tax=Reticulibacter mediterranei TaxID=2778369 RepID=A0A8J3IIL2_9CHLR|nr:baseplate J/gp47 family protein [Reticulibacter mediterranei]GHO95231.1 hypothetical protein KSF_052790 [Reticulibacter mediterranei]